MGKQSIQGYVEFASGLGEMTKGAARDAAAEFVSFANRDLSAKKVSKQASKVADDLIAAANTNRKNLVSLVRSEVDKAMGRLDVAGLQQELSSVVGTVNALRSQVEELSGRAGAAAAGAVSGASALADTTPQPAATPARRRPPRSALKKSAATSGATTAPATKAPATKTAAKKAPAKRASTAASTAKKAPAKRASTAASTAKKAPAKRASTAASTAKKAPAKRASTAKTTAKKAPAKRATAAPKKATPAPTATKATGASSASGA